MEITLSFEICTLTSTLSIVARVKEEGTQNFWVLYLRRFQYSSGYSPELVDYPLDGLPAVRIVAELTDKSEYPVTHACHFRSDSSRRLEQDQGQSTGNNGISSTKQVVVPHRKHSHRPSDPYGGDCHSRQL